MMQCNYHTHTVRCGHAQGEDREYVEQAIERGLKILGFSDHTPYPFPEGYVSSARMRLDQLEGYVDSVLSLKKEYAPWIDIRLGLETEYFPAYFDKLLHFLGDYPIEYMILGQHSVDNEIGSQYCGWPTDDPVVLEKYVDQAIKGMKTGKFIYLAHPDLINFTGDRDLYKCQMHRLAKAAVALDIPLEINFLGLWEHRNYPNETFWEIAAQEGGRCVFGIDAHRPDRLTDLRQEEEAEQYTARFGLPVITDALQEAQGRGYRLFL